MAGKTISEKILSAKSGHDARAGDVVVCRVDSAMGNDGSTPMALDYFEAMGGRLEIRAVFKDREVRITQFEELAS